MRGNADFAWDKFDARAYVSHNYDSLRDDDAEILELIGGFFSGAGVGPDGSAVDVGTGANLYPALAMLPFCRDLTLYEYSASNVAWLRHELQCPPPNRWGKFWARLERHAGYDPTPDVVGTLRAKATLCQDSIFDLPRQRWDIGTMFFVAESLTSVLSEFEQATRSFVQALRPAAPFAAAFMSGSEGYVVGAETFPAVAVKADDIEDCLGRLATRLAVHKIVTDEPLRDGYDGGMILATGFAR